MTNKKSAAKTTKTEESGVFVILSGTYYSRQPGKISISMPYEVELQLTDNPEFELPVPGRILSICRNKLLPYYFNKNRDEYTDYAGIRECRIVDYRRTGTKSKKINKLNFDEMTMEELFYFAFEKELNVDPYSASSIDGARRLVSDAFENKKLEERTEAEKKEQEQERLDKEFANTKEIAEFAEVSIL